MKITYSSRLVDYLLKKNRPHILIEACESKSCGGPLAFLTARAVDEDEMRFSLSRARQIHKSCLGHVLVMVKGFDFGDTLKLDLDSFFGIKDVVVETPRAAVV